MRFDTHVLHEYAILPAGDLLEGEEEYESAAKLYREALLYHQRKNQNIIAPIIIRYLQLAAHAQFENSQTVYNDIIQILQRIPEEEPKRHVIYLALSQLELNKLDKPDAALASARSALQHIGQAPWSIRAQIWTALGDAHKFKGNAEEAKQAYEKAEAFFERRRRPPFEISSFALTAEAFLERNELEEARKIIEEWQNNYPAERLTGNLTILKARLLIKEKRPQDAVRELKAYLGCDAYGVFAQQALELLADIYAREKQDALARASYQRLLTEFQDDDLKKRVEAKIERLGQSQ
jgi:tetratricopeptide (TPR) repeat protein